MAELRYTYLLDVKDRASRQVQAANDRIAKSVTVANRAMEKQGAVAASASRRVQTAGARQSAEWKQVARAAQTAERTVAQAATQASTKVSRALDRQIAAQRKAGASYAQIARQQKAAGASASATAAAIERSAARETAAAARTQKARQSAAQAFGTLKTFAGLGVGLGFAAATRDTIAFDKAMRNVNSIAQLSEGRLGNLKKQVLALAGPTAQAPKTLADGLYDLVSSGFKARDALVVLRSSAKAATAGLTTTEVSTKAVAAVLNAYHVGAKGAANVSDILFQTVNRGVITFEALAENIGDVLPFATSLGVKFTEVGAAVSTMTKEGISAPETMTRVKNAMVAFIKPSEGMAQALKKIGVESGEQLIKQRGFQGALEAVIRTTDGSKGAVAKLFPNIRALGGALALTGKNAKAAHGDLEAFRTGVKGATDRALSQQSKSLAFQWQQLKANAQAVGITIGQTLLPPLGKVFAFLRQHPTITKAAAALVAVGVAVRAIRFASALTGATGLLRTLTQIGAKKGALAGITGAAPGSALSAGRLATYAAIASRVGALVIASLAARKALVSLTEQAGKSKSGVERFLGKVGDVVHAVGWAPIEAAANRLKKTVQQLSGISPKLAQVSQSTTARLQAILGKLRGRDIAQSFAAEAASAGNVTVGMIRRVTASLGQLKGDARREARLSMQAMLKQLVAGGTITAAQAAKLEKAIAAKFGSLKDDLSGAARRGIRAITREFGALPGGISNPLRLSLAQTRSYMGRIISVVNVTVQQLRTMRALLAAGIEPVSPRSIGGGHRPAEGRTGGRMGPGGFRRYQQGGVVPAMVSPGEMIVHQGRAGMVPGAPVAADNVAMMLPVGAAVLTGDGQRRMAAGASVAQAVASQAPHFRTGGHVRGRVSWFGGPHDSQDSGRTALGLTTATPGVAIRPGDTWQTGRPTLGQYWRVRLRNGRSAVLRQTDLGPNQSTGRRIDLTYSALSRFGYREGNFPTDSIGVADLVGKGAAAGGAGTPGYSYRVSGLAQAQARRVGPSRTRQGLVSDAYQQGFDQGVAGLTRSRLAREPDTAYRAIAGAYRLPAARTVNVPGKPGGGGRPGGGGGSRRLVEASRPIRDTWAWARAIAAKFGLTISSSYRTPARNRAVGGVPNSWHIRGSARRPEAFDFSGSAQARARAQGWFRKFTHPDETLIHDAGSGMHLHVGGLYRRGGWVGAVGATRRYRTGTSRVQPRDPLPRYEPGAPMSFAPIIHQETTGPGIPAFGLRLKRALDRALTWAAGTLDRLNATIQQSADRKLGNLRGRLLRAIQRGGTEAQVKRLQAALSLIDKELARRAGLIERKITQRQAASELLGARGDIALRLAGTDPEGVAGLTARLGVAATQGRMLWRTRSDLEKQLRFASLARNRAEIDRLRAALNDNMTAIIDSRASQRELGRARDDARKSARLAFVAGLTQIQTDRVGLAQTGRQTLELQQRLAGTYDTGGQARADYITQNVIPALQAEREGLRLQGIEAMRQNNADLARQLRQAWEEKGNDILQAQLDAQEETARNTADTADALKNLGGTLSFEFQGSRLTDDLLASGVGA